YNMKDGLSDLFVRSIYEDREGTLWFGTYGNGLNRFRDGKFTACTTKDGLFNHTVSQILEDDHGNFWMTSNNGIYRASKKELDDFAMGKTVSITCVSYGTAEGMKSTECNGGFQSAGCKTRDGRLWFPTVGGVVMIDPGKTRLNQILPPVIIEKAIINMESVDLDKRADKRAEIEPGKGELEFHYTALSFLT